MEHEILVGEQLLDYVAERITLQDSLESVLRLLALHSLVNGGLKEKEFNTVRKELIQVRLAGAVERRRTDTRTWCFCTTWSWREC
mgnify:FL=1